MAERHEQIRYGLSVGSLGRVHPVLRELPVTKTTPSYLIWSIEHDAWWRPGRMGYTRLLPEAGRYPEPEAREILAGANLVAFHECLIPAECASVLLTMDQILGAAYEQAGDRLRPEDAVQLRAIEAAAGIGPTEATDAELVHMIREYYADHLRAARTPRPLIYLHLGLLLGRLLRDPDLHVQEG